MIAVASVASYIGAIILALHMSWSWEGYWLMLIGSFLWVLICLRENRDNAEWIMWVIFNAINIVGVWMWTPWQG